MEIGFLRLLGVLILARVAGSLPLDVAPPVAGVVALSAIAIVALVVVVAVIAAIALIVIRAIKKNQAGKGQS